MAAPPQTIDIPLIRGLRGKDDKRAMQAPGLAIARDVHAEEHGGLQPRPRYQALTDSGSNTIGTIRKLATYRDELLAFTADELWSYGAGDGLWTSRGEYLAVKVAENARFVTTGEQYDCDMATLGGVNLYAWAEDTTGGTAVYVAATDAETGSVILSPVQLGGSTAYRPRVTATTGRLIVTYFVSLTSVDFAAYDPADIVAAPATSSLAVTGIAGYDVIPNPVVGTEFILVVARGTTAGYRAYIYTEGLSQSHSLNKARAAKGAISVSFDAIATDRMCVTRNNGTAIESDILDESLVDVSVGIATGTAISATVNQIASVYAVTGTCTLFWSAGENTGLSNFQAEWNTVTNGGTAGTEAQLSYRLGLASRAFAHNGNAYVWTAFASASQGDIVGQLQNNYLLIRTDGLLVAKAVISQAGGFAASAGHLPQVQSNGSSGFTSIFQYRRIVPLGKEQKGYAAKSPQEVTITFDSDEARRTSQIGDTLYISGGILQQYDGSAISEVSFHNFPWDVSAVPGGGGTNLVGTYNFKQTYSWYNAAGEFERSTTATTYSQTVSTNSVQLVGRSLNNTAKRNLTNQVAHEWWRQIADAPVGAPYYLTTSKDPAATGTQGYQENDATANSTPTFVDDLSDADLLSRETFPENGGLTLENLPPPACTIVTGTQDRLLLAGIAGNPNRMQYSKLRGKGEIASFHDSLYLDLPSDGGDITAISFQNETMIVFKESAIYALPGDGYDNNGAGQNYGPARLLASDVGCISQDAVALTPRGLLFKSLRGWYMLQGWQPVYIGGKVSDFDADEVSATTPIVARNQVIVTGGDSTLVWDWLIDEWFEWRSLSGGSQGPAALYNNLHTVLDGASSNHIQAPTTSTSGSADWPGLDLETGWLKLGEIQGYKLCRKLLILGEYLGAHNLRIRVAYDYIDTWIDDKRWSATPTTVGGPLQVEHGPSRPKCQAIKFRITAEGVAEDEAAPVGPCLKLTGLTLVYAVKGGANRLPSAQKQ